MEHQPYVLTLIEATGIQDYIFSTNNLSVNLGASERVEQVTRDWLMQALPQPHNLILRGHEVEYQTDPPGTIEGGLQAEVIYRGGGNALILFREMDTARACIRRLSTTILRKAPGLQIVAAHLPLDWTGTCLAPTLQALRKELAKRKLNRAVSTPLPGLGVTAACVFTGQPAARRAKINSAEPRDRYFSAEVAAKLAARDAANERLHQILPQVREKGFLFVYDFDQLGSHGEFSYLALVHADGNRMGDRIERLLKDLNIPEHNRKAVDRLREFSISIQDAATFAMNKTVDLLLNSRDNQDQSWHRPGIPAAAAELKVETPFFDPTTGRPDRSRRHEFLPFRPIVFGGDDTTFITDGRLGLALAQYYLATCARQNLSDGQSFYCRAGMAVTKTHYPFSRAYDLAEDLAKSAKDWDDYPNVPSLDWHFATVGVVSPLQTIRDRTSPPSDDKRYMRPLRLDNPPLQWRTWTHFISVVKAFREDPAWAGRRNKVKALREALCEGPDSVGQFLSYSAIDGAALPVYDPYLPDLHKTGWYGQRCGYLDPIEALDFFIPLEG